MWVVPLCAAGFAGWLLYHTIVSRGAAITIRFRDGKGIEADNTPLKYRGVKIGTVTKLNLSEDEQNVEVRVQLSSSAEGIAREGARFWIVRPEVSMAGISGLQTIVSGVYVQAEPGHGVKTNDFIGLESPPVENAATAGGLKILLLASHLRSIGAGTPIFYRGVKVGETGQNHLTGDSQAVEIEAFIERPFTNLVRLNTKFWNAGGVDVKVGLLSAEATAQDLRTMIAGGVALATPNQPGAAAPNETAFRLFEKSDPEWLNWIPNLELPVARTNHPAREQNSKS